MQIGIFGGDVGSAGGLDGVMEQARRAEADGFASYWLPQIFGIDALTTLAVVGREVPRIELGTAVVPTWPRHPSVMAAQAMTVQAATDGRLALGIGLSHQMVVENIWGLSFERPRRHMEEYLSILLPLMRDGMVSFAGESVTHHGPLTIPGGVEPGPVLVAALGPRMLELAGRVADGTITWMTGPRTLEQHIVPSITGAAQEAGRPAPRVVAGLPVAVTDDADAAREGAAKVFEMYGSLPSYRAMLDREGVEGPAGVMIAGDEDTVAGQVRHLGEIGTTDLCAVNFGRGDDEARTNDLLRSLVGEV